MLLRTSFILLMVVMGIGLGSHGNLLIAQENGQIREVTLYRSQALVTRTLQVGGKAGVAEYVVTDLPETVVPDSLFAEGEPGLEVRAVQFRSRAVGASPREEVRDLEKQIQDVADQVALNAKNQQLCQQQLSYLDKLEGFTAPTAVAELSQGVLDAEALERLTLFSFEQREAALSRQVELARVARELEAEQKLLRRQLAELTADAAKTVREAVLYVASSDEQMRKVSLSYLVGQCGWSPTYTVRARADAPEVRLDYNGLIYQLTGEDWSNVKVTLSTASPSLNSAGPGIAPLQVTLRPADATNVQQQVAAPQQGAQLGKAQIDEIYNRQKMAELNNRNALNFQAFNDSNWTLNDVANQIACVVLFSDSGAVKELQTRIEQMGDQPSLSYQLENPVTLTSRNSRQMVRIISTELTGETYHVATPVLTSYVYRESQLVNESSKDLLGGPILVYLDDKFVGRGEIPTVARGQSFVIGLGADPQVRTRRELVEKTEGINGGNRELQFEYHLIVENFKSEPTQVRLLDRIPTPGDGAKIRVTHTASSLPLSNDAWYQRIEKPEGIMRWDAEVASESHGESSFSVDYGFTVEYDRQYVVTLPDQSIELKQDFERLQKTRTVR